MIEMDQQMPVQKERSTSPDTKAGGIERNRAYALVIGQARIQDLQPGHIGPGKTGTNNSPADRRPPEPVSQHGKSGRTEGGRQAATNENPLCINAVSQPHKQRRRQYITDKIGAADPSDLGIAQPP